MPDVEGLLEVSESCDTLGKIVAEVVARSHPELDRSTVAEVASVELFGACQDVALMFTLDVSVLPPPDDDLREKVARLLAEYHEREAEWEDEGYDDC